MNNDQRFWNRLAANYDQEVSQDDLTGQQVIAETRAILRREDRLLDFACATGNYSVEFAPVVNTVHGIDIASEMIELARTNAARHHLANLEFSQISIHDPALPSGGYDAIIAFNILHLLDDLPESLARIRQLLAPGGRFISLTPCLNPKLGFLNSILKPLRGFGLAPHLNFLQPDEVRAAIEEAGFKILKTETIPGEAPDCFAITEITPDPH
jgi:2-polyprenyl-3-methyl-5-hydroxy-6-metoxy-1,4-benzoquinol methylase